MCHQMMLYIMICLSINSVCTASVPRIVMKMQAPSHILCVYVEINTDSMCVQACVFYTLLSRTSSGA